MPKSSGAWVRMPIWIERSGSMMPFAHGARHEGAVVDALAVVVPGVLMRVELHQRQRAVDRRMRLQQRPGDEMVAAERQQEGAGLQDLGRLALDRARRLLVVAAVEQAVAIVDRRRDVRTGRRWNGYCGSQSKIAEARRIACGPKRAPGRLVTAASNGMPQTTAIGAGTFLE